MNFITISVNMSDLTTVWLTTQAPNITQKSLKAQLLLYDILIPSLGAFIIVLNLAVVVSSGLILKKGSQPRSTYLFLGNVAMSDLVTGIAVVLGQTYPKSVRTQFSCGIQLGLIVASTVASIYSVGLIAIDRYLYIIHGLQYQRWVYPMRARLLILITWIIGGIVGFLPVMGWSGDTQNGRICWFIKLVPPKLVMMTCIIGLIPILIVIILYSIILYHAIKKVIQLRNANANQTVTTENRLRLNVGRTISNLNTDEPTVPDPKISLFRKFFKKPTENIKGPTKAKAVKVVLFTTGSFIITWVPYFVASFIYVNCDAELTPKKCRTLQILIASPLAILGFVNSLLNPIIYAWWHKGFRMYVKKILCRRNPDQLHGSSSATRGTNSKKTSVTSVADPVPLQNVDLS